MGQSSLAPKPSLLGETMESPLIYSPPSITPASEQDISSLDVTPLSGGKVEGLIAFGYAERRISLDEQSKRPLTASIDRWSQASGGVPSQSFATDATQISAALRQSDDSHSSWTDADEEADKAAFFKALEEDRQDNPPDYSKILEDFDAVLGPALKKVSPNEIRSQVQAFVQASPARMMTEDNHDENKDENTIIDNTSLLVVSESKNSTANDPNETEQLVLSSAMHSQASVSQTVSFGPGLPLPLGVATENDNDDEPISAVGKNMGVELLPLAEEVSPEQPELNLTASSEDMLNASERAIKAKLTGSSKHASLSTSPSPVKKEKVTPRSSPLRTLSPNVRATRHLSGSPSSKGTEGERKVHQQAKEKEKEKATATESHMDREGEKSRESNKENREMSVSESPSRLRQLQGQLRKLQAENGSLHKQLDAAKLQQNQNGGRMMWKRGEGKLAGSSGSNLPQENVEKMADDLAMQERLLQAYQDEIESLQQKLMDQMRNSPLRVNGNEGRERPMGKGISVSLQCSLSGEEGTTSDDKGTANAAAANHVLMADQMALERQVEALKQELRHVKAAKVSLETQLATQSTASLQDQLSTIRHDLATSKQSHKQETARLNERLHWYADALADVTERLKKVDSSLAEMLPEDLQQDPVTPSGSVLSMVISPSPSSAVTAGTTLTPGSPSPGKSTSQPSPATSVGASPDVTVSRLKWSNALQAAQKECAHLRNVLAQQAAPSRGKSSQDLSHLVAAASTASLAQQAALHSAKAECAAWKASAEESEEALLLTEERCKIAMAGLRASHALAVGRYEKRLQQVLAAGHAGSNYGRRHGKQDAAAVYTRTVAATQTEGLSSSYQGVESQVTSPERRRAQDPVVPMKTHTKAVIVSAAPEKELLAPKVPSQSITTTVNAASMTDTLTVEAQTVSLHAQPVYRHGDAQTDSCSMRPKYTQTDLGEIDETMVVKEEKLDEFSEMLRKRMQVSLRTIVELTEEKEDISVQLLTAEAKVSQHQLQESFLLQKVKATALLLQESQDDAEGLRQQLKEAREELRKLRQVQHETAARNTVLSLRLNDWLSSPEGALLTRMEQVESTYNQLKNSIEAAAKAAASSDRSYQNGAVDPIEKEITETVFMKQVRTELDDLLDGLISFRDEQVQRSF
jgi:hypothetical protein